MPDMVRNLNYKGVILEYDCCSGTFTVVPLEADESWPAVPRPLPARAEGDWVLYTPPRTETAEQLTARAGPFPDALLLAS